MTKREKTKMSFRKHNRNKVIDYKTRLEHKLYLARENPELVFDISDCALKNVPSGIYLLCKVFRKNELRMGMNKLSSLSNGGQLSDLSLLTILDISNNEFVYLPPEISCLTSLQELYLQNNLIKKLPKELTEVNNLKILNLSNNKLNILPEKLGNLKYLSVLDISYNGAIENLPKSLGQAQKLIEINLDGLNIIYPPEYVIDGGAIAIVAYLSEECGLNYTARDAFLDEQLSNQSRIDQDKKQNQDYIQEAFDQLEKAKEKRQNALLEVEKNIKSQQKYELELQSINKGHKKKLLEDLALQQSRLELEIERIQQEREANQARLISSIYEAEKEADSVIKEFLRTSEAERQAQAKLLEREKKEMQVLSQCYLDQSMFRTRETLISMEELLQEELLTEKKVEEYTKFRDCNAQSLLSLELRTNDHLAALVQDQKRDREKLLERLRKDEVLQKAALAALLERSDARSWSIVQQVNLVQSQLVALTNIELERRKLEINQQINDIAEKRVMLSGILVNLLEQQEKRREQLLDTINQIESRRADTSRRNSLFWLMQYQSLMEARPQGLLEGLEPMLVRHVAIAGALHCLPFLASLPSLLPNVNEEQLEAIGISNGNDRQAVMLAVENYLAEKKLYELPPSVPIDEPCTSNTNNTHENRNIMSIDTTECAICLDSQCEIIFLPCGHLCCCAMCSNVITSICPLCRSLIQRKIQVHLA